MKKTKLLQKSHLDVMLRRKKWEMNKSMREFKEEEMKKKLEAAGATVALK